VIARQKDTTNTYVINDDSGAEMARLIDQERFLTRAMGELLAEQTDVNPVAEILDIGCGPGGWAQHLALAYPEMEVTGIDLSPAMIEYAKAYAQIRQLPNAHFQVMDATQALAFPDGSFDLVNASLISGFLFPQQWSGLMAECKRVLRSGGILRLTEGEWGCIVAAPAVARLFALGLDAMYQAGRSFSPDGRYHAITPMLPRFLRHAGFQEIHHQAYVVDYSSGTPAHEGFVHDYHLLFVLGQPFILKQKLATQDELDALCEQAMIEMRSKDFGAMLYLLCAWGKKAE